MNLLTGFFDPQKNRRDEKITDKTTNYQGNQRSH